MRKKSENDHRTWRGVNSGRKGRNEWRGSGKKEQRRMDLALKVGHNFCKTYFELKPGCQCASKAVVLMDGRTTALFEATSWRSMQTNCCDDGNCLWVYHSQGVAIIHAVEEKNNTARWTSLIGRFYTIERLISLLDAEVLGSH